MRLSDHSSWWASVDTRVDEYRVVRREEEEWVGDGRGCLFIPVAIGVRRTSGSQDTKCKRWQGVAHGTRRVFPSQITSNDLNEHLVRCECNWEVKKRN